MVDGSASAVPAREVDRRLPQERDVGLGPWVLVAADHDAGVVPPEEKQVLKLRDDS